MGYNYRNGGMPDFHASAGEVADGIDGNDSPSSTPTVHDPMKTVGSPNPSGTSYMDSAMSSGFGNTNKSMARQLVGAAVKAAAAKVAEGAVASVGALI